MSDPKRTAPPSPSGLILTSVAGVQLLVSLDLSIVNVALPEIASGLQFGAAGLSWVIHAYALTFGGLMLLGGKLADRLGHRRVLLIGLALFAVASLLAGIATSAGHLIAARALQGVGAAAMQPASLAVLATTFSEGRARARAFGIWSAVNALGGAFGVILGGIVTEYAGWRWVMLLNVPVAICAIALAWRAIPGATGMRSQERSRPDIAGGVLATAGMTLLVFAIVRTAQIGWTAPATLSALAVAGVLLYLFVRVEKSPRRDPLLRLGLLANRNVTGSNVFNLLVGAAMASCFYFVSLYVQNVLKHNPATTGLMFLPLAAGVIVGAAIAVGLSSRLPPRALMTVGALTTAAGFAWFGMMSADGAFLTHVLGPSLATSLGFGLCLGPVVSIATRGVAEEETGIASGLLASSRQLGASLGLAVLGTIAQYRTGSSTSPGALSGGYGLAMTVGALLLLAAAATALIVVPRSQHDRPQTSTSEQEHGDLYDA
jgi:EmrB/QacA subfamily drug resistance transporter